MFASKIVRSGKALKHFKNTGTNISLQTELTIYFPSQEMSLELSFRPHISESSVVSHIFPKRCGKKYLNKLLFICF